MGTALTEVLSLSLQATGVIAKSLLTSYHSISSIRRGKTELFMRIPTFAM